MKDLVKIKFKSNDVSLLDSTVSKIIASIKNDGVKVVGPIPLPTRKKIYTILRATHKYSYSQEQFEKRVHCRLIELKKVSSKTINSLQNFNVSSGVNIEIKL